MDKKLRDIVARARESIEPEWVSLPSQYKKLEKAGEKDQLVARATVSQLQLCEQFKGTRVGIPLVMFKDTLKVEEIRQHAVRTGRARDRYVNAEYLASGGWVNDLFPDPRDQAIEIVNGLYPLPTWRNCHGVLKLHMMLRVVGALGGGYAFTLRIPNALALLGEAHPNGLVRMMGRRINDNFKRTRFAGRPILFTLEYSKPPQGKKNPHIHGVMPASPDEATLLRQLLRKAGTYRGQTEINAVRLVMLRNSSWSNYFTKQYSDIERMHGHQPYYANNPLIGAAEALYGEARHLVKDAHAVATAMLADSA